MMTNNGSSAKNLISSSASKSCKKNTSLITNLALQSFKISSFFVSTEMTIIVKKSFVAVNK